MKILEVENLTCGYDSRFFIQEVDFNLEEKEFVGIIGPNGSGKTTFLRAISRLLRPKRGKIFLEGDDIWRAIPRELARKMALVSQSPPVNDMSVEEFILLGRIPHFEKFQFLETRNDFEIAHKAMLLTDTLKFRARLMDEMSGGERQMVFIARALAQEPKLLLLDEPTTHLDITHQVVVMDLLKRLNREFGLTVLIVLHDLNLASEYCARLALMNEGKMYKVGAPEDVLSYQVIEEVYKTIVVVKKNPISLKPYIFLVPEDRTSQDSLSIREEG